MKIRRATIKDAREIYALIANFAARGDMLPRPLSEIYEHIRDYLVCIDNEGRLLGVSSLHIMWEDLAEIRSLAVYAEHSGKGVGTKLVEACIDDAVILGIKRIFALTYKPAYFKRFGFDEVDKSTLPQKIWSDCLKCSKFPDCDETAVIRDIQDQKRVYEEAHQ
ncbi:MAG: N-acetyltransferase [Deltaproteobacteria bacterium]|nr:N-acetyltransferase [Deltaproteobacteria bacterium]NIS77969.1 N-acetyltransferase [Deltaproteobacteria bacterium]